MELNHLKYEPVAEYSIIFNREIDNVAFIKMLSKIDCKKAISILSRFAALHLAVRKENQDAIYLDWQLRFLHSSHIKDNDGDWLKYNQFKFAMCSQSIFNLQKWVLSHCPVEEKVSPITLPDIMLIMDALLISNDMLPKDEVKGFETEYLYLALYHNTHKIIKDQIARSFYVFSTLAKFEVETKDFLLKYEQKRGFSIEDRLAVLFNSLASVIPEFTIADIFTKEIYIEAEGFDAKLLNPVYDKIIRGIRNEYDSAKRSAIKVLEQIWNFEPFYLNPFVKIGDLQFAYSETMIVYQMWEGLYWDVRFTFKEDGEDFMTGFGKPFERYIQEITCAAATGSNGNVIFQNEFFYNYKKENRASTDCYIRIGKAIIAIEAKAKSPHSNTLKGVSREYIDIELKELMIDPITQVLKRTDEIYSEFNNIEDKTLAFFEDIEQIIILSVTMEKVQPIGELLHILDENIKKNLAGTHVVAYHNVSIDDYEVICNLIETSSDELATILVSWFMDQRIDKRSAVSLANFYPVMAKITFARIKFPICFQNQCMRYRLKHLGKIFLLLIAKMI